MNEVIAALIIACSNLTHGESSVDANRKAQCVQRVSACSAEVIRMSPSDGDLDRTMKVLQKCSKEVHL